MNVGRHSASNAARRLRRVSLLAAVAALMLTAGSADAWAQFMGYGGAIGPPPSTGFFGWLLAQQAFFYRALDSMLRAAKINGSAYWGLMGISFIYGVFHAAGPGHGKAMISSYLLANDETWRRGITLSFASAVLQSLSAITIVLVAALLIGGTAQLMGETVRSIETFSYALIIVVGLRLLWVKGKSFRATLHRLRADHATDAPVAAHNDRAHGEDGGHAHCHHGKHAHDASAPVHAHEIHGHEAVAHEEHGDARHGHDSHRHSHDGDEEEGLLPWGHSHGPEPEELAGPGGWKRGFSAVIAAGVRPCSGAIIVLVFALAQGLLWAGIASTFVMGLGTAITVGAIASLAVGFKSVAKRMATPRAGYGVLVLRGLEVGASGLVILVGAGLLTGYIASEHMGFF
jgi:nickel/cobalt transporter (NicO) family protein